jgi:hypothetical protein
MHIRYFTIAGGNQTALILGAPSPANTRLDLARTLLTTVEQVGFIETETPIPTLTMMGGELCINALLAFVYRLEPDAGAVCIHTQLVHYQKTAVEVTVTIPLPYTRIDNTILFDTIGYLVTRSDTPFPKTFYQEQAEQHHLPAFGSIQNQQDGSILPLVYVRDTNSLITETACGSGSVAFSIITGITTVIQPTHKAIAITEESTGMYRITAEVAEYYP